MDELSRDSAKGIASGPGVSRRDVLVGVGAGAVGIVVGAGLIASRQTATLPAPVVDTQPVAADADFGTPWKGTNTRVTFTRSSGPVKISRSVQA